MPSGMPERGARLQQQACGLPGAGEPVLLLLRMQARWQARTRAQLFLVCPPQAEATPAPQQADGPQVSVVLLPAACSSSTSR